MPNQSRSVTTAGAAAKRNSCASERELPLPQMAKATACPMTGPWHDDPIPRKAAPLLNASAQALSGVPSHQKPPTPLERPSSNRSRQAPARPKNTAAAASQAPTASARSTRKRQDDVLARRRGVSSALRPSPASTPHGIPTFFSRQTSQSPGTFPIHRSSVCDKQYDRDRHRCVPQKLLKRTPSPNKDNVCRRKKPQQLKATSTDSACISSTVSQSVSSLRYGTRDVDVTTSTDDLHFTQHEVASAPATVMTGVSHHHSAATTVSSSKVGARPSAGAVFTAPISAAHKTRNSTSFNPCKASQTVSASVEEMTKTESNFVFPETSRSPELAGTVCPVSPASYRANKTVSLAEESSTNRLEFSSAEISHTSTSASMASTVTPKISVTTSYSRCNRPEPVFSTADTVDSNVLFCDEDEAEGGPSLAGSSSMLSEDAGELPSSSSFIRKHCKHHDATEAIVQVADATTLKPEPSKLSADTAAILPLAGSPPHETGVPTSRKTVIIRTNAESLPFSEPIPRRSKQAETSCNALVRGKTKDKLQVPKRRRFDKDPLLASAVPSSCTKVQPNGPASDVIKPPFSDACTTPHQETAGVAGSAVAKGRKRSLKSSTKTSDVFPRKKKQVKLDHNLIAFQNKLGEQPPIIEAQEKEKQAASEISTYSAPLSPEAQPLTCCEEVRNTLSEASNCREQLPVIMGGNLDSESFTVSRDFLLDTSAKTNEVNDAETLSCSDVAQELLTTPWETAFTDEDVFTVVAPPVKKQAVEPLNGGSERQLLLSNSPVHYQPDGAGLCSPEVSEEAPPFLEVNGADNCVIKVSENRSLFFDDQPVSSENTVIRFEGTPSNAQLYSLCYSPKYDRQNASLSVSLEHSVDFETMVGCDKAAVSLPDAELSASCLNNYGSPLISSEEAQQKRLEDQTMRTLQRRRSTKRTKMRRSKLQKEGLNPRAIPTLRIQLPLSQTLSVSGLSPKSNATALTWDSLSTAGAAPPLVWQHASSAPSMKGLQRSTVLAAPSESSSRRPSVVFSSQNAGHDFLKNYITYRRSAEKPNCFTFSSSPNTLSPVTNHVKRLKHKPSCGRSVEKRLETAEEFECVIQALEDKLSEDKFCPLNHAPNIASGEDPDLLFPRLRIRTTTTTTSNVPKAAVELRDPNAAATLCYSRHTFLLLPRRLPSSLCFSSFAPACVALKLGVSTVPRNDPVNVILDADALFGLLPHTLTSLLLSQQLQSSSPESRFLSYPMALPHASPSVAQPYRVVPLTYTTSPSIAPKQLPSPVYLDLTTHRIVYAENCPIHYRLRLPGSSKIAFCTLPAITLHEITVLPIFPPATTSHDLIQPKSLLECSLLPASTLMNQCSRNDPLPITSTAIPSKSKRAALHIEDMLRRITSRKKVL